MGSFNVRCSLTQLPIRAGDPVVLLFGVRPDDKEKMRDYAGGFVYQSHFFKLITTPVYGNYNDYGWIEDKDQSSTKVAVEFLKAVKFEGLNQDTLSKKPEDVMEALKEAVRDTARSRKHGASNTDYAFVHRNAWDKLLEAGRNKMYSSHVMLSIGKKTADSLKKSLKDLGFSKVKITQNGDIRWLEADSNFVQIFTAACKVLPESLPVNMELMEKPANFEELIQNGKMAEVLRFLASSTNAIEYENSVASWLMSVFHWMRPMFSGQSFGRAVLPNVQAVNNVLEKASKNPSFYKALEDVHVIFESLMANQLIIRANSDLPSQAQDSSYWGHIAIVKAMGEIIHRQAVSYMEDTEDDEEPRLSEDAIENLMLSELKSTYC